MSFDECGPLDEQTFQYLVRRQRANVERLTPLQARELSRRGHHGLLRVLPAHRAAHRGASSKSWTKCAPMTASAGERSNAAPHETVCVGFKHC